jgi:hypothetical protein
MAPQASDQAPADSPPARKPWVEPVLIRSADVRKVTAAKTSSGFGFETHSPGSLNGS